MPVFGLFKKKRRKKIEPSPSAAAVIVAAGNSTRMDGIDKQLALLEGMPVLARTLMCFENCKYINEIVVVTSEKNIIEVGNICRDFDISKVSKVICGGERRMDSVLKGLLELSSDVELVAIHDGARPLVSNDVIINAIKMAEKYNAATPAISVTDTVKTVENGIVTGTPNRSSLYAVQTPQVFNCALIKGAISRAIKNGEELFDDCTAVELMGVKVHISEGSTENIKITYSSDLWKAEAILKSKEAQND